MRQTLHALNVYRNKKKIYADLTQVIFKMQV